jgi:hypothetical protein
MTTWSRSEKTVTTIKYTVPAPWPQGATWAEVEGAMAAAKAEAFRQNDASLSDDAVWVTAEDDQIVISFPKKEEQ